MKILFVTKGRSKRGGHIILTTLARELRERGHEARIVCFEPDGLCDTSQCQVFWEGIDTIIVPFPGSPNHEQCHIDLIREEVAYLGDQAQYYDRIILDSAIITWGAIKA
jgi:hypothetical protein